MLLLAASLAACGQSEAPPARPAAPPAFATQTVAELALYPERSAPATVVGKHEARITAEVTATIVALPVDVGQAVQKGEVIARLAPRDAELALARAQAALAQAEARHAQARAQLARARALREKNFISEEALTLRETELAAAAADLAAAIAQRDTARHQLDKHTLRAPFDAVVRARSGQVGELATPGLPLLTLVARRELELAAQLQPRDAASLARAVSPAPTFISNGNAYAVKLLRISPVLHRESRSVEARLVFVTLPPPAGAEGRLVWRETVPHLPPEYLVRRADALGVFVMQDGRAHFHALAEAQEGRPTPLDLPATARIVTTGRYAVQEGQPLP